MHVGIFSKKGIRFYASRFLFSHLFLSVFQVINEAVRLLKNLWFVFPRQAVESRISHCLEHAHTKNQHEAFNANWRVVVSSTPVLLTDFLTGTTWRRKDGGVFAEISIGLKVKNTQLYNRTDHIRFLISVRNERTAALLLGFWLVRTVEADLFLFSRLLLLTSWHFFLLYATSLNALVPTFCCNFTTSSKGMLESSALEGHNVRKLEAFLLYKP